MKTSLLLNLFLAAVVAHAAEQPLATAERVATSKDQWTGIAVAPDGAIFVNYPRWSDRVPVSVARIVQGQAVPFPDARWNAWKPGDDPAAAFVCVQALAFDEKGTLWVLDPASPKFQGVVEGGAKLLQFDPASGKLLRTIVIDSSVARSRSYLNDLRIDIPNQVIYMTDSEEGALIVLDLKTGKARRLLDAHPSTEAENITLTIGGKPFERDGKAVRVHSDGIAWDPENDRIYYQALTGRTLYEIPAAALRDTGLTDDQLAARIRKVGQTGAADGLWFGPDKKIYITALEKDAILRTDRNGNVETVVSGAEICWPDSFAAGPDGWLYFTTARIHEGDAPQAPYGIHRIKVSGK